MPGLTFNPTWSLGLGHQHAAGSSAQNSKRRNSVRVQYYWSSSITSSASWQDAQTAQQRQVYEQAGGRPAALHHRRWGATPVLLLLLALACLAAPTTANSDVHSLLLTDCGKYQDWQALAGYFAWQESGHPGKFTRIANCNPDDVKKYPKAMVEAMPTHFAPMDAWNPELKDWYGE
jgi:hypothetical protein